MSNVSRSPELLLSNQVRDKEMKGKGKETQRLMIGDDGE